MKSPAELHEETTVRGIKPTITVGETYAPSPISRISDTFALFKPRVTSLVVLTAWAVTGALDWVALALVAISFFWQFPHFLSIAWPYREDYARAGIRRLPVVKPDGEGTIRRILGYGAALIPIRLLPTYLGIAGRIYFFGAIILGLAYLFFGVKLAMLRLPATSALSKKEARQLLQASVVYLPLLLVLMMLDGAR